MTSHAVITGGAGFLGSHLADRLLSEGGWDVTVVDNFVTGSPANVRHLAGHQRFALVAADVAEHGWRAQIDSRPDLVFHLACPASPAVYGRLTVETLVTGAVGTLRVLDYARDHKARFILAGTSEVYGDPLVHPQPETYWGNLDPTGPRSCYGEAKRYAEALTTAYRLHEDTDTGIARLFNVYGPRMGLHDGRVIPQFIGQALAGESLTIAGDGRQSRSFCYVTDVVDGLLALCASGHPGPVNIGRPDELTIREVAEAVLKAAGIWLPFKHVPRPEQDPERRCPDVTLARQVLSWRPVTSFEDGLARTVAWYRDQAARP